ncbi:MAG: IS110 family transposase [Rhodospirillales bacterium]|nr:IS110 family transposase [Rhodospirillales bacterium]
MKFFSGLDVSMERTAALDELGLQPGRQRSGFMTGPPELRQERLEGRDRVRIGHHLRLHLHRAVVVDHADRLPAICLETRHVRGLSTQRNKTDATDALALAHIVRTGWFRQAHIKTESCYRLRLLLTQRRNLKRKVLDLENTMRHSLKAFGIRIKGTGRGGFDAAVREAVTGDAVTSELMDAMRAARAMRWKQYRRLHDLVLKFVARHELCRRFMAIPGVDPVTALSFVTAIDDPSRFRRSRDVAAYFGLTSRRWQSGTSIDVQGRISKAGDGDVRRALYEAASALMTRFKGRDKVQTWGLALARRSCHRKATVAVARKLAVIMHAMWTDGTCYVGDAAASTSENQARAARKDGKLLGAQA